LDRTRQMPETDKIEPNGGSAVHLLTQRERDCLALVSAFKSSKQIAEELDLSPFTVNQHIASAMRRLQVADRRQAAQIYANYRSLSDAKFGSNNQGVTAGIPNVRDVTSNSLGIVDRGRDTPSNGVDFGADDDTPPNSHSADASGGRRYAPDAGVHVGNAQRGANVDAGTLSQSGVGGRHSVGTPQDVGILAASGGPARDPRASLYNDGRLLPTLNPVNDLSPATRVLFIVAGIVVISLLIGMLSIAVGSVGR